MMLEEQQRIDMDIARQLRKRSDFLAKYLFAYQDQQQLSDEALAQAVGVPVEKLAWLACYEWPLPEEELPMVMMALKADGPTLLAWLHAERQ